jgi:integrase
MVPLSNYVRLERPVVTHDFIFVNLGRRGFGQPFRYRSWVAICDQARRAAGTPRVHAHAFRHTFATNMAEGGMPLDALQRVLGHRHMDTVMIYNEVRQGRVYREYQEAMAVQNAARRLRGQAG